MKVIGYVRVSTEDQASDGVSLDAQLARVTAYSVAKGWDLVGVETDRGFSAKDTNRPGIQGVLSAVRNRQVEAVIVYKLDRLTRSVVDLNNIIILLDKKGVALVSLEESIDATTATGRLMLNVLVSVSQWEREVIGERTKEAMSYLKENQRVYNGPVYGFDARDGLLYPNAEEQAVIERIKV